MTGRPSPTLLLAVAAVLISALDGALLVQRQDDAVASVDGAADVASPGPSASPSPSAAAETLQEQLERIARLVAELRGLPDADLPVVRYVSRAELADEVRSELDAYSVADADRDARVLVALGVLEPGTDLRALILTAYSEQVAGFYDPEVAEIVVPSDDTSHRLGRLDELTLAHEIGHALVDAGMGLVSMDLADDAGEDAALAATALQEGDAELVMAQYIQEGFSLVDQLALAQEMVGLVEQLDALTALPPYVQQSLEFPYIEGFAFVQALHERGGWAAVNAAYADPPTTTYEILYPDAYLAGFDPVAPPPLGDPGRSWTEATTIDMGAADVRLLFGNAGVDGDGPARLARADRAASTWRGGTLRLWTQGEGSAVAWHLAHVGGSAFCTALRGFYDAAIVGDQLVEDTDTGATWDGPRQAAAMACDDTTARLAMAPDLATASRMLTP